MSFPTRKLGTQGLEVSAIGLGCMGMTGFPGLPNMYGPTDEAEAIATLHRAIDLGITFLDTAEIYGPYDNEELLGRALAGKRQQVILATKFGFSIDENRNITGPNSTPASLRKAAEGSLKRLNTDYLDLLYQHRVDPAVPIEDTVGEMKRLVEEGKVRFLGLSEASSGTIRRAQAIHPISALQTEYSIWERGVEEDILITLRELGIGFVPYSPLGRGFLTGVVTQTAEVLGADDYRSRDPRYLAVNMSQNERILATVKAVAARTGATPAQVALAWLLHQGPDVVPIPGTKKRKYLEENAQAVNVTFTAEDLADLKTAAATVAGERYSEMGMKLISLG
jgi:aryl-alcohol dehydrogenase-like predicted oxidoreductase